MLLPLKLALSSIRRNPARTFLTALAMIAAASIVSWMVAGYDSMLSQFDDDAEKIEGRFDFQIYAGDPVRGIPVESLEALAGDPRFAANTAVFTNTHITVRNAPDTAANDNKKQREPGKKGGRRGGGRRSIASHEATPPVFGLPTRDPSLTGTDAAQSPLPLKDGSWLTGGTEANNGGGRRILAVADGAAAEHLGLKPGSLIVIGSEAGIFPGVIVGVTDTAPSTRKYANLFPGRKLAAPAANTLYVSRADADRVAGGKLPVLWASFAIGTDKAEFAVRARELLDGKNTALADANQITAVLSRRENDERGRMQAWSATAVSLLVSFFIIYTTLSMGVDERIRQFALLRAVALGRAQIAGVILSEALVFGLLGWGGGLASGALLVKFLPQISRGGPTELHIGFWTVVLTGICAVAGAFASAVVPVCRAVRIRALDAMRPFAGRDEKKTSRHLPLIGLGLVALNPVLVFTPGLPETLRITLYSVLGCPAMALGFVLLAPTAMTLCRAGFATVTARLFGLEPAFLQAQLRANFWRGTGTVISLSIGLGFYMMILIWSASMLIPFLPGGWMPDLFAAVIPGGLSPEAARQVATLPEVRDGRCLPVALEQVKLARDITQSEGHQNVTRQDNVVLVGMNPAKAYADDAPLMKFHYLTDRAAALKKLASDGNYCLIPEHFALVTGLKAGDSFEIVPPDAPGTPVAYEVAGIIEFKGWHWFSKFSATRRHSSRTAAMIFASDVSVNRVCGLTRVNFFWMDLKPGATENAVVEGLRALTLAARGETYHIPGRGDAKIRSEYIRPTSKKMLEASIAGRTDSMVSGMLKVPLLILLVTSLAVANTAVASIRARSWEIGVMRACGLSGFSLMRLIIAESLLSGAAAVLLSLGFGLCSGICSAQMAASLSFFGGMGWNFMVPWTDVAKGFALTLALCFAGALIPALIAGRREPLSLLRSGRAEL